MECKVTCFQRTMHTVKSIASNKQHILAEACDIVQNYTFQDLLDFGVEVGCFDQISAYTLYDGIVMWEDLEGNYFEEDYDKLHMLYEKMGITKENRKAPHFSHGDIRRFFVIFFYFFVSPILRI